VEINISIPDADSGNSRAVSLLKKNLAKAGFTPQNGGRFLLEITVSEAPGGIYAARWILSDSENAVPPLSRASPLQSITKKGVFNFANALSATVFTVR
jgi:hypothetical protein